LHWFFLSFLSFVGACATIWVKIGVFPGQKPDSLKKCESQKQAVLGAKVSQSFKHMLVEFLDITAITHGKHYGL